VGYSDGSFPFAGNIPFTAVGNGIAICTGGTVLEVAQKLTPVVTCRTTGAWFSALATTLASGFSFNLYQGVSATPMTGGSVAMTGNDLRTLNNSFLIYVSFPTPQTLTPGTTYYLSALATTAYSNRSYFSNVPIPSSSYVGAFGYPPGTVLTQRNSTGTGWTDQSNQLLMAGLILDQVDNGAGGGGASGARIFGGF
jgi:hypothetical protein